MNMHVELHGATERFLIDAEYLIADRGGRTPGYANDPAKLLACNKWVDHARPIIMSMLMLDDEAQAPLTAVRQADPNGYHWNKCSPQSRDCKEAITEIGKAYDALNDMLDGIRDAFISDECPGIQDDDDAQQEADDFSDWLTENTVSVKAAIDLVAEERWQAFITRAQSLPPVTRGEA